MFSEIPLFRNVEKATTYKKYSYKAEFSQSEKAVPRGILRYRVFIKHSNVCGRKNAYALRRLAYKECHNKISS